MIRDELLNILLASRDTTAALLTFTTYLLALHPAVFKTLREEVIKVCGPDGQPTYESVRELKYMRAVLNEVLRLFPPVPVNARSSLTHAAVLPPSPFSRPNAPLYCPSNTTFLYIPLVLHRRKDLWGEDADEFKPERWIEEEGVKRFTANPMMWLPFNAGPRICLGQQFAYNEASFFLVRLLQKFDRVTLAPECQPEGSLPPESWKTSKVGPPRKRIEKCWPLSAITLYAKGGLWVRFKPVQ